MEFTGFDWDAGNLAKCQKNGVSPATIESLFQSGLVVLPDDAHSQRDVRYRAVGRTNQGRALFVVFTLRVSGRASLVRPISARYMHEKEALHYAKIYEA